MKYFIKAIVVALVLLIAFIAILYLNSVFAHLWLYGGPPGDKRHHLKIALFHLGIFFFCIYIIFFFILKYLRIGNHDPCKEWIEK